MVNPRDKAGNAKEEEEEEEEDEEEEEEEEEGEEEETLTYARSQGSFICFYGCAKMPVPALRQLSVTSRQNPPPDRG